MPVQAGIGFEARFMYMHSRFRGHAFAHTGTQSHTGGLGEVQDDITDVIGEAFSFVFDFVFRHVSLDGF